MKKRLIGAILSTVLTVTMATPAFAEIIWTADKLPAGYTTNEWENKDFYLNAGTAIKRDTYTFYVKDLHGNLMKNASFAGGSRTDENGVFIDATGHVCSYGTELAEIEYFNSVPYSHSSWQQDSSKPLNENGISNYWYGSSRSSSTSIWEWLMVSPDGKQDGLKYAYCFNEYGYLYTNTITPDGYQVNELGQLMIDGKVMTRKPNDVTPWYGFVRFPIGALGYDYESSERASQTWGTPNPYF
ncbi:hypothetical protein [Lacrimispora sp. JR3]|uniref:hypothetical protein n=1 Tax=Lacrimispora sinapis TaxID=3111456 RepID=UPI003748FC27